MRVLFVSPFIPSDTRTAITGVYQRMRLFIDAIKEIARLDMLLYYPSCVDNTTSSILELERLFSRHWDIDLHLSICPRFQYGKDASKWKRHGPGILSFYRQSSFVGTSGTKQLQAFEACLDCKPDIIFAHRLASMCPLLLTRRTLPPVFLDLDDIEHIQLLRSIPYQSRWPLKILLYSFMPALLWGERRAMQLAQRTFVCSEGDRDYLTKLWKLSRVVTIPNPANTIKALPVGPEVTLLFIGSYGYQPNIQAAEFLLQKIWPRVQQALPEARLIIAGAFPERIAGYELNTPGVEFSGFIDDIETLYRRVRVVCAPLLVGSGTRIKIIEAASYGKPIVATRIGAEGLAMQDGRDLLIRDDPASFAEACITLLKHPSHCQELGSHALATVVCHYRRDDIIRLIQKYLQGEHKAALTGTET